MKSKNTKTQRHKDTKKTRHKKSLMTRFLGVFVPLCLCVSFVQGGAQQPPATARGAAQVDFTGYWVSVVTEDWRWRMVTPARGDFAGVPLNATGRKLGEAWDPAKDEAAGEQCKAYGAAGLMRIPGRLHIFWQDDNTLKLETDAGSQTRILTF